MNYSGKEVLVIGLGLSGRAAAGFLLKRGAKVVAVDRDIQKLSQETEVQTLCQQGLQARHDSEALALADFDSVVVSPGVPQSHPLYAQALSLGLEVIGEVELACRHIAKRCVGITGSNGKTTTTLLTAHILNSSGKKARALGNVGIPLTRALESEDSDEILVVELSSWQLETLQARIFDAGAILNVTPNHLDRHGTMQAYAAAKFNLKNCLKNGSPLFMGTHCWNEFQSLLGESPVLTFGYEQGSALICDQMRVLFKGHEAFKLPAEFQGRVLHDVENMMAAFALCQIFDVTGDEFLAGLSTFRKPPHRIEFVKKIEGVAYYDDSKGTSIDAVIKAVSSMEGKTHLIAGGVHKGASYSPWRALFAQKVSGIYAIGQAAAHIQRDLEDIVSVELFPSLEAALECAASRAKTGENVLLSPGCSSYDMFKDYNHRGDAFKRLVQELG